MVHDLGNGFMGLGFRIMKGYKYLLLRPLNSIRMVRLESACECSYEVSLGFRGLGFRECAP